MIVFPEGERETQPTEAKIAATTLHVSSSMIANYSPSQRLLIELLDPVTNKVPNSGGESMCSRGTLSDSDCNNDPCEVRGIPGACCMIGGMYFGCDPCGGFMPIEV